jgi:hypothetical protein
MTIAQDTASLPAGESHARKVTFTTADAAVASTDFIVQQTRIEGYNAVQFLNQTFTVGFWVRSSKTGNHSLAINNGTSSYCADYQITVANTWQYKTITVVGGSPALASTTSAFGLVLSWCNLLGSNFRGTVDTWTAGTKYGTVNQVNDADTINATFHLAGVTINPGSVAAIPVIDYGKELIKCQRYYEAGFFEMLGYIGGANNFGGRVEFRTEKKSNPTIAQSNTGVVNCAAGTNNSTITTYGFTSYRVGTGAGAVQFNENWTAAARL